MRKKIALSFGKWILLLAMILVVAVFTDSLFAMTAFILLIVITILSWAISFVIRKQLQFQIFVPTALSKKQVVAGQIRIKNKSVFSTGKVYCVLSVDNVLTGEKEECILETMIPAGAETSGSFEVQSKYCGYVKTSISEVVLTDWFGFLPLKVKTSAGAKTSVLPETFAPHVSLAMSYSKADDAENWSPTQKGQDYTEVFALRDYAEGDSLKQIHWKMSSKRNQLIVKEASLPTTKSLLLLWDKNTGETNAEEMDAMAEVASSVAQAISEQGIPFCLGWTEGKTCIYEDIENDDELLQTIPRIVKAGADNSSSSGANMCSQMAESADFSKVIYFAKQMPDDFQQIGSGDMTLVLCSETADNRWRTYTYKSDTYQEDLHTIEL